MAHPGALFCDHMVDGCSAWDYIGFREGRTTRTAKESIMNVTITKTYTTRTGNRGIVGKVDGRSFARFIRRNESPADAVLRIWGVRIGSKARRGLRFEDHFLREDGFTGALRVDREVKVIMNDHMKPLAITPDADGIYRNLADGLYQVTAAGGDRFFTVTDGHLDHLYRDQVKGWLKAQGWI